MNSAVAKDGLVYGINFNVYNSSKINLVCIDNGKIAWTGEENFLNYHELWSTILFENTVIAAGVASQDNSDNNFPLMVCYTLDGKKIWDKKLESQKYMPTYTLQNGKIWIVSERVLHVLDPKTGLELKKVDLSKDFPSAPSDSDGILSYPSDRRRLNVIYIRLAGDLMFLFNENYLKNYQIKDDLSLEFRWEKAMPRGGEDKYPLNVNYSTWSQANNEFFISIDSENQIACYDSKTGDQKWDMGIEGVIYSHVIYNKIYLFVTTSIGENLECYNISEQRKMWDKKGFDVAWYIADKYVYLMSNPYTTDDVGLELVRLRTGGTITKVTEQGARMFIVDGDNVFFLKERSVSKYTMCNPCACNVNVSWKANGKDTIDIEVCRLEGKRLEIQIENPNEKAIVECVLSTSQGMYSLSESSISVGPGETKIVTVSCSVGMEFPEELSGLINVKTNCNQTFKLGIEAKKSNDCKEKLKKNWSIPKGDFLKFDDVLVRLNYEYTGFVDTKLTEMTAFSSQTDKTLWTITSLDLMPNGGQMNIIDVVGNLMVLNLMSESADRWVAINGKDGKIVWKRKHGLPARYGVSYETECSAQSQATAIDLFDIATGNTLISKLKVECNSNVRMVCKIGQNYLVYVFKYDKNNHDKKIDDQPHAWLVRSDGKVYWKKNLTPCLMNDKYEYDSLYLIRDMEPEEENNDYFKCKLAKVDPIKLKELWSTTVDGNPSIVMQDENKVVFYYYGGISCHNPVDGKKLWSYSDENHGMSDPVIAKGLLFTQTWNRDNKNPEKNKMYVIDPSTGKNMHEMEFEWYASYFWDENRLFVVDENWGLKPKKNTVYCIDVDNWQTLWTTVGYGELVHVGEKLIFDDGKNVSWFEKDKMVGTFVTSQSNSENEGYAGRASDQHEWFDDLMFVRKRKSLWVLNANDSSVIVQIPIDPDSERSEITYEYLHQYYQLQYITPCVLDGKVLYCNKGMMEQYDVVK